MLKRTDPQIYDLISFERERQLNTYSFIASENICTAGVLEALGSELTNKYSEGYSGQRYYNGNKFIDEIESLAIDRTKKLFGVKFANVQSYSGSPANQAVYMALINPGDTVLGFDLAAGGHLSHGFKRNFSGKYYNSVNYNVNPESFLLDYDEIRKLAIEHKPKLIVCGVTAYPRNIDFKKFSEIAKEVGAYLLADISHISGLVVAGIHPSPVGFANVIMTTTQKQLRGPRGAVILTDDEELAKKIDRSVFPGLQGGPHNNVTAAIAVCMQDCSGEEFKVYMKKVIENRQVMQDIFQKNNLNMFTGGSDNHIILLDVGVAKGRIIADELESFGIVVNANTIPYETSTPLKPSGIRIGTPSVTSKGITREKLGEISEKICEVVKKNS